MEENIIIEKLRFDNLSEQIILKKGIRHLRIILIQKILPKDYATEIAGAIEIKNNDPISLFFVKKEFHGKGIEKKWNKIYTDEIYIMKI